jgi:hypothetical protein
MRKARVPTIACWMALFLMSWAGPAVAGDVTGSQLEAAAVTAVENGVPGSDFVTLLEGAAVGVKAYLNTKIYAMRRNITIQLGCAEITWEQADLRYQRLTDIQERLEKAKNGEKPDDPDKGKEPFYARFTSNVPLTVPLPPSLKLTLVPGTAVAYLVDPPIWGGGWSNPPVLGATMDVGAAPGPSGGFVLSSFSFSLGSFLINGSPSGTNTVVPRPGAPPGTFAITGPVGPTMLEFLAFFEGEVQNQIYGPTNPIVYLSDVQGYVDLATSQVVVTTSEPMIVPGAPGVPKIDAVGRLDAGARAVFDATAGRLTFGENTDLSLVPDVTVVRDAGGTYFSHAGQGEPVIGASLSLGALQYLGTDPSGAYRFADAAFSITDPSGTYVSGTLTDVHLDPVSLCFTSAAVLDPGTGNLSSPFLDGWRLLADPTVRFMSPIGAADLIEGTQGFTSNWTTGSDWISLTPEPATLSLLALGGLTILLRRRQK